MEIEWIVLLQNYRLKVLVFLMNHETHGRSLILNMGQDFFKLIVLMQGKNALFI